MSTLFRSLLYAAQLTADEQVREEGPLDKLATIFTARKLFAGKPSKIFNSVLQNSNAVTGSNIASTYRDVVLMIEDIAQYDAVMQLNRDLKTAWKNAQITNNHPASFCWGEDIVPILIDIIPEDFNKDQLKLIRDFLEKLNKAVVKLGDGRSNGIYDEYSCFLTHIEGAFYYKLHGDGKPGIDVATIQQELANAETEQRKKELAKTLSAENDRAATVASLKAKYRAERLFIDNEELLAEQRAKSAKIHELNNWFKLQHELTLAHQINEQFKQYKSVLETYIQNELRTYDPVLHAASFPITQIAEVIAKSDEQIIDENEDRIKTLAKNNLNFSRAVANYKLIHDAETRLRPSNPAENRPAHLINRLKGLYNAYPEIDHNLQMVGNEAVDKATSGIRGFFRKLWSSVTWYFSDAGKKEREFKKSAQGYRQKFFTVMQNHSPVADADMSAGDNMLNADDSSRRPLLVRVK